MKYLILFVILATSYALSPEFIEESKKKAQQIAEHCIGDSGVTPEEVGNIKTMQGPSTHEGKCFITCFQKQMGLLTADGKLDKASGMSHIEALKGEDEEFYNKIHGIMDKCYGEVKEESDPCETGLNFGGCIKAGAHEAGIGEMLMKK